MFGGCVLGEACAHGIRHPVMKRCFVYDAACASWSGAGRWVSVWPKGERGPSAGKWEAP